MPSEQPVTISRKGTVTIVQIDRPHARNAVDGAAAHFAAGKGRGGNFSDI